MKSIEPTQIAQQMIDFQKTAFENTYNAMIMFQSQTEKMAESMISKNTMIPEEGQKMINEWMLAVKKGRDEFKKTMDDNFAKLEDFLTSSSKATKSAIQEDTKLADELTQLIMEKVHPKGGDSVTGTSEDEE